MATRKIRGPVALLTARRDLLGHGGEVQAPVLDGTGGQIGDHAQAENTAALRRPEPKP